MERSSTDTDTSSEMMFLSDSELDGAKKRAGEAYEKLKSDVAEISGGRKVDILLATKTVDVRVINHLIDEHGLALIGENKVQELIAKWPYLHHDGISTHLIGTLQSNKVKYIIDKVDMIESVGSLSLAQEIEKQAAKHDLTVDILAECNIGREENKSGMMPEDMQRFCETLAAMPHIKLRGIMTMAPRLPDEASYTEYFKKTYEIFIDIFGNKLHNIIDTDKSPILSMGMSSSWRPAVMCGSTEIRVGTTVFGERIYTAGKQ